MYYEKKKKKTSHPVPGVCLDIVNKLQDTVIIMAQGSPNCYLPSLIRLDSKSSSGQPQGLS